MPFFKRPVSLLLTLAILMMIVVLFPLYRGWRVGFGTPVARKGEM